MLATQNSGDTWCTMSFFPLPLFPDFSLPSSIMATVLVGVGYLCFFNLRFGWPLSGLVVPGFIAPILLAQPSSAAFIMGEGVVTYVLARGVSGALERTGYAAPFFGRDRFFLIVLLAVCVRLACDTVLLPLALGAMGHGDVALPALVADLFRPAAEQGSLSRLGLGSFGLVVSALFANQLWKPGVGRGLLSSVVVLALTYLTARWLLVPFTNFNPGRLSFLYDEVGSRMADSPKAYIILLSTALLASRLNLLYGWEFAGIMIPSLLALAWFDPMTIAVSLAEALAILVLAGALLKLPLFRSVTMEGARKILFFFSVSFILKLSIVWAVHLTVPAEQPSDFFGFGFLLSTLIAAKAYDKKIFLRMAGTTLQASAAGLALGLCVSAALAQVRQLSLGGVPEALAFRSPGSLSRSPRAPEVGKPATASFPTGVVPARREPTAYAALHRIFVDDKGAFAEPGGAAFQAVDEAWLRRFSAEVIVPFLDAVSTLERGGLERGEFHQALADVARRAEPFCYVVQSFPRSRADEPRLTAGLQGARIAFPEDTQGVAVLMERPGAPCRRHQAAIVVRWAESDAVDPERIEPVLVALPRPLSEAFLIEAGLHAFERLSARALVIPLARPDADPSGAADVLSHQGRSTVYRLAQESLLRAFGEKGKSELKVAEFRGAPEGGPAVRVSAPFGGESLLSVLANWSNDARFTELGREQEAVLVHNRGLELLAESLGAQAMGTVWLSRAWRQGFEFHGHPDSLESVQFRSLGIPSREASLAALLRSDGVETAEQGVPARLRELLAGYVASGEVSQLDELRRLPGGVSLERIVDVRSRLTFLVFRNAGGKVLWVASLGTTSPGAVHVLRPGLELTEANVDAFAFGRLGWLEFST